MDLADKLRATDLAFEERSGFLYGYFYLSDGRQQGFWLVPEPVEKYGYMTYTCLSPVGSADDVGKVKDACILAGRMDRAVVVINETIMLVAQLPVDLDAEVLRKQLEALCNTADIIESGLSEDDRF